MTKKSNQEKISQYYLGSFILFILAFALRYQGVLRDTLTSLVVVLAIFFTAIFLLKQVKKLPVVDIISLGFVYLLSFVDKSAVFNQTIYGLAQPLLFAIFGLLLVRIYNIKLELKFNSFKKIAIIFGVSILFAYLFLLLNEPFPTFLKGSLLLLLVYTFFVSLGEEIVFRGVSFPLVKKLFPIETAVHLQAIIFTVIHLVSITALYSFFAVTGSLLLSKEFALMNVLIYALALYGFAIVAARYANGKKNTNIAYPVFFHWLVNFLNLVILIV